MLSFKKKKTEEDCEEENEEDDDEVVITGVSNLSESKFETSLDNSILLNSTKNDEDDPVAMFCNSKEPKLEDFIKIKDDDKLNAIKDFLSNAPEDDYLTHLVFTILKLSSISEKSKDAHEIALELFKEAFEYAKTKDRVSKLKIPSFK